MRIIIASNNEHKVEEIKKILGVFHFDVVSLNDAGIDIEVEEDQETFEGNAYKKAREIFDSLSQEERGNALVLSDDTGLAVDYLGGAPGVYSARYAGVAHDYAANNEKLLKELLGVPLEKRSAKFVTSMVLLGKDMDIRVSGEAAGRILEKNAGNGGFGYDPLFYSDDLKKSFAESTGDEKNSVSHRGRALEALIKELNKRENSSSL